VSAAAKIIDRLHNVQRLRPDSWRAGCPLCQSRQGRPVHVRQIDDRVLLKPFCGCSTADILGALGLRLADLYDRPLEHSSGPVRSRIPASDLLEVIDADATTAAAIIAKVRTQQAVTTEEWERLAAAVATIQRARDYIHAR